jgi:hypothetical protein
VPVSELPPCTRTSWPLTWGIGGGGVCSAAGSSTVSHANTALSDVRKAEARELAEQGRQDLKGVRQAILFGAENVPERTRRPSPS